MFLQSLYTIDFILALLRVLAAGMENYFRQIYKAFNHDKFLNLFSYKSASPSKQSKPQQYYKMLFNLRIN
jgi:hypothetical protein